jgi:uncharacterized membrane protein YbhN (UPF0104 family)
MRHSEWQYIGYILTAVGGALALSGGIALYSMQQRFLLLLLTFLHPDHELLSGFFNFLIFAILAFHPLLKTQVLRIKLKE